MIEQRKSRGFTWQNFGLFVGLTLVGFIMAGFLHIESRSPTTSINLQDFDLIAALVGFVFGAVSGLVIGSLQWIVLKSWTPNARFWIPLNAIALGLVHLTHDALPYQPLPLTLILVMDGIVIGLAQSIALRQSLPRDFLWVPVAAFAWTLGFQVGFAWLNVNGISSNPLAELVAVFGTAGLVYSAISGLALMLIVAGRFFHSGSEPNPKGFLVNLPGDANRERQP